VTNIGTRNFAKEAFDLRNRGRLQRFEDEEPHQNSAETEIDSSILRSKWYDSSVFTNSEFYKKEQEINLYMCTNAFYAFHAFHALCRTLSFDV